MFFDNIMCCDAGFDAAGLDAAGLDFLHVQNKKNLSIIYLDIDR